MSLFSACVYKIIPLYFSILIGFFSGKKLNVSRDTVVQIMLYILNPIVIFNGIARIQIDSSILMLPIIVTLMCGLMCFVFYKLAAIFWNDKTKSLIGFSAGNGNTGYFGLPIALFLFDDHGEGVYIFAILGVTLFENTVGFLIFSDERMTFKEAFYRLLKVPVLYAFAIGLIFNLFKIPMASFLQDFMRDIKGAYSIFGMMIIGLGLSGLKRLTLDYLFIGLTFLARFVAWPLTMISLIYLDQHFLHFFDPVAYNALLLISIVPLGTNSVLMATLMNVHPEKAASAVILSILIALFFVPFMVERFMCVLTP